MFRRIALVSMITLFSMSEAAQAAPTPTTPPASVVKTAPAASSPSSKDAPATEAKAKDDHSPQPGKPIQLIGPSYLMYGEKTLQIGTVDFKEKKALSSIILSPPWDAGGINLCGAGALGRDDNKCVAVTDKGAVKAPGGVVIPTIHLADLTKDTTTADNTLMYCDDYTFSVPTGLFHSATIKGGVVIARSGHWYGVATGLPVVK